MKTENRMTAYLTDENKRALQKEAKKNGLGISSFINFLIAKESRLNKTE